MRLKIVFSALLSTAVASLRVLTVSGIKLLAYRAEGCGFQPR
jgi:hypothetical protein